MEQSLGVQFNQIIVVLYNCWLKNYFSSESSNLNFVVTFIH